MLDDEYPIGESKDAKAVISGQLRGGKEIGQILNISEDIVKLGVTGSGKKADELKKLYAAVWGIDSKNDFKHSNDFPR